MVFETPAFGSDDAQRRDKRYETRTSATSSSSAAARISRDLGSVGNEDRRHDGTGATRITLGSGSELAVTRSSNRPRACPEEGSGSPPLSGMRRTTLGSRSSSSALRRGNVTSITAGGSSRLHKLTAPARPQRSQPPPSHSAQRKLRGSVTSTGSPRSSQLGSTRTLWTTSAPRGVSRWTPVTRPRTWAKSSKATTFLDSAETSDRHPHPGRPCDRAHSSVLEHHYPPRSPPECLGGEHGGLAVRRPVPDHLLRDRPGGNAVSPGRFTAVRDRRAVRVGKCRHEYRDHHAAPDRRGGARGCHELRDRPPARGQSLHQRDLEASEQEA